MAIEIRLTKELGDYEPKLIGPFTGRQCLCLLVGLPFCFLTYYATSSFLPIDVAGFLIAIPGSLAAFFGWAKPYGMKPEKFLRSIMINIVLAPANRKYKTKNIHEEMLRTLGAAQEAETSKMSSKDKKKLSKAIQNPAKNVKPEYYL